MGPPSGSARRENGALVNVAGARCVLVRSGTHPVRKTRCLTEDATRLSQIVPRILELPSRLLPGKFVEVLAIDAVVGTARASAVTDTVVTARKSVGTASHEQADGHPGDFVR